jgi:pimeloyl-ACP methyl ester carboxylesterase
MHQAYCSWCYHQTHHTLEEKNYLRRNRYKCMRCSNTTYECRVCRHMARGGRSWDDELCAEHAGELSEFRKVSKRLSSIDEAHSLFQGTRTPAKVASIFLDKRLVRLLSGCVDGFKIDLHRRDNNSRHGVIFINGFLSQGNTCNQDWSEHLGNAGYGHDSWYRVHWESSQLDELISSVQKKSAKNINPFDIHQGRINHGSIITMLGGAIGGIVEESALHWYTALLKAEITGRMLGIAISRTPGWTFTLIGHSLGARVIQSALVTLAHIARGDQKVERAILLGGAVDCTADMEWSLAIESIKGHLDNGISQSDDTLRFMYQSSLLGGSRPAGLHEITINHRKIRNFDCTDLVSGHKEWKPNLDKVLARMNQPPARIFTNTFSADRQRQAIP